MRDYSKISPALWQSERFNTLPTDDARYLYLYLLTNEHQTSAGAYRLPDGYACTDLRWPPDRYQKALADLVAADLVMFDAAHQVIGITRWFRHNPPMSESHLVGIARQLERLPSKVIVEAAQQAAVEAWRAVEADKAARAAANRKGAVGPRHELDDGIAARLNDTRYLTGTKR